MAETKVYNVIHLKKPTLLEDLFDEYPEYFTLVSGVKSIGDRAVSLEHPKEGGCWSTSRDHYIADAQHLRTTKAAFLVVPMDGEEFWLSKIGVVGRSDRWEGVWSYSGDIGHITDWPRPWLNSIGPEDLVRLPATAIDVMFTFKNGDMFIRKIPNGTVGIYYVPIPEGIVVPDQETQ